MRRYDDLPHPWQRASRTADRPRSARRLAGCGRAFGFALLSLLLAGADRTSLRADEPLRWTFAVGDRFDVAFDQSIDQATTIVAKTENVKTVTRLELSWEVTAVDDGVATMNQIVTRVAITLEMRGETTLAFDTDVDLEGFDPTSDFEEIKKQLPRSGSKREVAMAIVPLLRAPYRVRMTDRGEILEVAVPERSLELLREANGSMTIRELFETDNLTELLTLLTATLPEGEVSRGTSWDVERKGRAASGGVRVVHHLTYDGMREREGRPTTAIDVSTELVPDEADDDSATTIVSHQATGTLWFDRTLGMPVASDQTQTLTTRRNYREFVIEVVAQATTRCTLSRRTP